MKDFWYLTPFTTGVKEYPWLRETVHLQYFKIIDPQELMEWKILTKSFLICYFLFDTDFLQTTYANNRNFYFSKWKGKHGLNGQFPVVERLSFILIVFLSAILLPQCDQP